VNIIYALSGEGRGHGSLARAILPVLQRAGHNVKVVTYGQSIGQLADYDLIPIKGIKHYYDGEGRLSLSKSLLRNLGVLAYYATGWKALRRQFAAFSPDVLIVNFEPFAPLIARSLKVPIVSFDNQHALLYFHLPVPKGGRWSAWITKTAIKLVVRRAEHYVIMALAPSAAQDRQVHVVPPVVQDEFRQLAPRVGSKVLVYLKRPNGRFLEILKRTDQQFLVYGYNTAAVDGNLTYRVFSDRMPEELSACKAVMGTAGMSLMSEAVWLKKPFFGIPLKNEFEQMWNAVLIRQSNFGDFSEEPTKAAVDHFFQRMNEYRRSLEDYRFDPDAAGKKLLELIEGIRGQRTNELAARDLCARRLSADLPRAIVIAGVRLVTPVTSRFLSPPG
jgi:uncharacterized protein (TIGR00661 family)